jgi:hypothetical protein
VQSVLNRLPLVAASVLVITAWLAAVWLPFGILAGLALHWPGTWMAWLGAAWVVAAGTAGGLVVRGTA